MAKRPNILKLATKISLESMTYMGITYDDPEYKILEPIIDDDMCAIMMHVRLETNRTVEEVAKRARKSVEFTQEQLDKLCKTGAVRYRYVDGKRCYFYPIWVPGIMEGILANREQCDKYPVLGESFEAYTRRRPEMLAPCAPSSRTRPPSASVRAPAAVPAVSWARAAATSKRICACTSTTTPAASPSRAITAS